MSFLDSESQKAAFNRDLYSERKPLPAPSFWQWSTLSAAGPAAVQGLLETAGSTADLLSGFATPFAASTGDEVARRKMLAGDSFDVTQGNTLRRRADEWAPDPETTHIAGRAIAGVSRGVTKAVGEMALLGPVGGPLAFGLDEGNTATQRLRTEGVDTWTAVKAGGVIGLASGLGAGLPAVGKTIGLTIAYGAGTGPATFIAQEALVRNILAKADYSQQAATHDPFDPLGLPLSMILPGLVGGAHIRSIVKANRALEDVVKHIESGGKRYAPDGSLLTSPKGAQGEMQVMPGTASDPGFGVVPARDQSPEELARVGRDYLAAMVNRYGDRDRALAAYNAGPGAVDAALNKHGADWFDFMPAETRQYVERARSLMGEAGARAGAADPAVLDAARTKMTEMALTGPLPDVPEARTMALSAADAIGAGEHPNVPAIDTRSIGIEKIVEDVRQQAIQAGYDELTATQYGRIYAARYATRAERNGGLDPWEAYQQAGVSIRPGLPGENMGLKQPLPTALPTSKKVSVDLNDITTPSIETLAKTPGQLEKAVNAVAADPGMMDKGGRSLRNVHSKAEYLIERMKSNLLWLHDQVPGAVSRRSRLWYDGAQRIAQDWSVKWGKSRAQTSGMLAALSPQKDWFMNVTMAERVGDILRGKMHHRWDKQMDAAAFKFLLNDAAKASPDGARNSRAYNSIKNKTLGEVARGGDVRELGIWIRAYDEAHHGAAHAVVTPEGGFAGRKRTASGEEARRAWGDFSAIGKAASIYVDGSIENISKQLGNEHKVRNFYNNIFNASDPRFATIDTHAVAAAQLRPLAGADKAVSDNFGGTGGSNATGISGSYPLYLEAYKRAAAERGILPREMQSITWEAVRGLFTEGFKTAANKKKVDAIWQEVSSGKLTVEQARKKISDLAGGIQHPDWWQGEDAHLNEVLADKTYEQSRVDEGGAKITFEVAPDPHGPPALKAQWDALPPALKAEISHQIAWRIAAKAMASTFKTADGKPVVLRGELHEQMGGYGPDSNPSLSIWLDPNTSASRAIELAKVLGHALNQESMLFTSPKAFKGGREWGAIAIHNVGDNPHPLYTELRGALGEDRIQGYTSADGAMIILAPHSGEAIAREIAKYLGDRHDVTDDALHVAFPEKGVDDYGLSGQGAAKQGGAESSVREAADRLRAEASQQLSDAISGAINPLNPAADWSAGADSGAVNGTAAGAGARELRQPGAVRGSDGLLANQGRTAQGPQGREPDGSLRGLPRKVGDYVASAYHRASDVAQAYARSSGIPYYPPSKYVKADPARGARIADTFEQMKHDPQNPEVKAAYGAMINETVAQYEAILKTGLKVEFIKGEDPYKGNPRNMTDDVRNNNHMWVFSTRDGFGSDATFNPVDNPLLAETGHQISGEVALANDIFRAVHDYFGHVKEGVGFRADGEENAWRSHMAMYSQEARRAATTETRGQNSWLNFGPHGEANRTAKVEDTHFADQKIGLLPDWVVNEGRTDTEPAPRGSVNFEDGKAVIRLFKDADASTLIHESSHTWLEELVVDGEHEGAAAQLQTDLQTVRDWLGNDGTPFTEAQHEQFARAGEAYFMEGKAPTAALARVFDRFKRWLTDIYKSVAQLDTPINDDIRRVFDRLLATDKQIAGEAGRGVLDILSQKKDPAAEATRGVLDILKSPDRPVRNALPDREALTVKPEKVPEKAEPPVSKESMRVKQLAEERPGMKVVLPDGDGEAITLEAALKQITEDYAYEKSEASLVEAAVQCAIGF